MSDHLLHLDAIDEGHAVMRMTCEHEHGVERWRTRWHEGSIEVDDPECWFMSWWDALGGELVDIKVAPKTWPAPVRPEDNWGNEDGGTIVLDQDAQP